MQWVNQAEAFSLDIYLHLLYGNVFIVTVFICAQPHLYVVSGGLWQLLVEPGRVGAAQTAGIAPQRHRVEVKFTHITLITRITEVILANKRWRRASISVLTGTVVAETISCASINAHSKTPDVVSWVSMSETNTI